MPDFSTGQDLRAELGSPDDHATLARDPHASRGAQMPPAPRFPLRSLDWPVEMRALWVTRWDFRTADDIRRLTDKAAEANFNTLFFQVRGNADALYPSALEPWAAQLSGELGQDPGWDPLHVALEEAHARGLELHAWINVYPAWLGEKPPALVEPEPMVLRFKRDYGDQWVVWDRNRQPMALNSNYLWANPGHPAVSDHIAAVGFDLVERYYLDGLHLDNVRYPGWEYSRDPRSLAAGETESARKAWQRAQIDALVARLHEDMQQIKPGLLLSAAVWPVYQDTWDWWSAGDGYEGFCQDSVAWVMAGRADWICPMLYLSSITQDDAQYAALVADFVARADGQHVAPGITATYDDFAPIGRRIDLARAAGAAGQALFSYGHVHLHNYWDDFRAGPYATPALTLLPEASRQAAAARLR